MKTFQSLTAPSITLIRESQVHSEVADLTKVTTGSANKTCYYFPGDECDNLSTDVWCSSRAGENFFHALIILQPHISLKFFFFSDQWEEKCQKYTFMCVCMLRFLFYICVQISAHLFRKHCLSAF